jgi:hypothetical protein
MAIVIKRVGTVVQFAQRFAFRDASAEEDIIETASNDAFLPVHVQDKINHLNYEE